MYHLIQTTKQTLVNSCSADGRVYSGSLFRLVCGKKKHVCTRAVNIFTSPTKE